MRRTKKTDIERLWDGINKAAKKNPPKVIVPLQSTLKPFYKWLEDNSPTGGHRPPLQDTATPSRPPGSESPGS